MSEAKTESTTLLEAGAVSATKRPTTLLWAAGVATLLSVVATALLVVTGSTATMSIFDGNVFQLHIVLMPVAFALCGPLGVMVWRVFAALDVQRDTAKLTHALLMCTAVVIASVGVWGIFQAHNKPDGYARETAAYGEAHLQSSHSLMGSVAFSLFVGNAFSALVIFYTPLASASFKAAYLPLHVFLGFVSVGLTMVSVSMGILSYAFRGQLEHGPDGAGSPVLNMIMGGMVTSIEYKVAALLLVAFFMAFFAVFFVSRPSDGKSYTVWMHRRE